MNKETILIASDHAGYLLKEDIKNFFKSSNIPFDDLGTYNEDSTNYADYAKKLAVNISEEKYERGILICGTGIGMSIVANRFKKVRAALCNSIFSAKMAKKHNDANVLVMGSRITISAVSIEIIKAWLDETFEGGRHKERIDSIDK